MALGAVPVSGAEPEFYDFIGEKELRPIINPDPCDFEKHAAGLERIVTDRELFQIHTGSGTRIRTSTQRHRHMSRGASKTSGYRFEPVDTEIESTVILTSKGVACAARFDTDERTK